MKKFLTFTLLAVLLITNACSRTDNDTTDNDVAIVQQNSLADAAMEDVQTISDQGADGNLTTYRNSVADRLLFSACATITHDTASAPRMLIINFGPVDCLCGDGRMRRGSVRCSYIGAYRDAGSTHTITTDNYYVNNNKIEGTRTVVNNGIDTSGNINFSVSDNVTITFADADELTRTSNRTRSWIAGYSTLVHSDDVYLITGSATGTKPSGTSFTMNIINPLRKEMSCNWIVSGLLSITPSGKLTRTIDFGNGSCDNQAQAAVGSYSKSITLY